MFYLSKIQSLLKKKKKWNSQVSFSYFAISFRQDESKIIYIITQVILAFWLVLAYDLLEDRRTDDDSARFKFFLNFLNFDFEPITILC